MNAWDESKPAGAEFLNTADDTMRAMKGDIRERMAVSLLWNTGNEAAQTDSGVVGASGISTLQDAVKSWAINVWKGGYVIITSGTGAGQVREVIFNTADTLTVDRAWMTLPDTTSFYKVEQHNVGVMRIGSGRLIIGLDNDKPTANIIQGTAYFATDIPALYGWDGTQWLIVCYGASFKRTLSSQPNDITVTGDGGVADVEIFNFTVPGGILGIDGSLQLEIQLEDQGGSNSTLIVNYGSSPLALPSTSTGTSKSLYRASIYSRGDAAQYMFALYQRDGGAAQVQGAVIGNTDSTLDQLLTVTCRRAGGAANTTVKRAAVLTRT